MLSRNVCDAVESPRVPKHEITPLDESQSLAFIMAVEADPLKPLFVLAIASGMRQGELLGLNWSSVDLKAGTLSVRRTLRFKRGEFSTNEGKTAKGRRLVDLPAVTVEVLHEHKAVALAAGRLAFPWVFCEDDGQPLNLFHVISAFDRLLKTAGLPAIRFHDLRHTSATLMLKAGTHPKIVQERLGHTTIAVTLDTCLYVLPAMQREAADRLNGMLSEEIGCSLATNPPSTAAGG